MDKRNPILRFKPELREAMVLRRKVHKIFDMLKCPNWNSLLEENDFKIEKYLVMRDCYLTFEMINSPQILVYKLEKLRHFLQKHLDTCQNGCINEKFRCQFCHDNNKSISVFEIELTARCPICEKIGHRWCLYNQHECKSA